MLGSLCLSALLPAFALAARTRTYVAVGVLFGAAGTAQLTPTSMLLDHAGAVGAAGEDPSVMYALFNCAYVLGMAVGPGTLAALTQTLGFPVASAVVAGATAVLSLGLAALLAHGPYLAAGDGGTCGSRLVAGEPELEHSGVRDAAAAASRHSPSGHDEDDDPAGTGAGLGQRLLPPR